MEWGGTGLTRTIESDSSSVHLNRREQRRRVRLSCCSSVPSVLSCSFLSCLWMSSLAGTPAGMRATTILRTCGIDLRTNLKCGLGLSLCDLPKHSTFIVSSSEQWANAHRSPFRWGLALPARVKPVPAATCGPRGSAGLLPRTRARAAWLRPGRPRL